MTAHRGEGSPRRSATPTLTPAGFREIKSRSDRKLISKRAYMRQWRLAHPENVAAYQARYNAKRRVQPVERVCVECGEKFLGRPNRIVCSARCKDRRFRRLHPGADAAKSRAKRARRKAAKP